MSADLLALRNMTTSSCASFGMISLIIQQWRLKSRRQYNKRFKVGVRESEKLPVATQRALIVDHGGPAMLNKCAYFVQASAVCIYHLR